MAKAKGEQGPAAQYVWRIDLKAPTTTITDKPSARTNKRTAAFLFEANEKVKAFECRLNDDPFAACTSPKNFFGLLDDGSYVFAVRAIDLAGNVGDAQRYQWRISTNGKTAVPNIVGMQLARGIDALQEAQLMWETQETTSTQPVGQILAQKPEPGTEVAGGSTVEIIVSTGSPLPDLTVAIPDNGVEVSCPSGVGSCVTTVTFTVTNQGKGDIRENFEVLVAADPNEQGRVTVRGGLAAGASALRTTQVGPGGNCYDPDCFVQVVADPAGNVPELNERNNVAEWTRNG